MVLIPTGVQNNYAANNVVVVVVVVVVVAVIRIMKSVITGQAPVTLE